MVGFFRKNPFTKYVNGTEHYVDYIDIDKFSVLEFLDMLSELGLDDNDGLPMFYHFQLPELDLDNGLHSLASDVDVNVLANFVSAHKIINVYTEHGKTNVKSYFKSPQSSKVRIEQLPDEPQPSRPKKKTPKKRLLLEWVPIDEQPSCHNSPSIDVDLPKVIDVGTEEVSKDHNTVEQSRDIGQGSGNMLDSYMDDHFFTDYIFTDKNDQGQGEAVVDDHGQGQGEAAVDDQGGKSVEGDSESSDSEFVVDDANMGDEVEVDMSDFRLNVDKDAEWMAMNPEESMLETNNENIDIEDMDIDDFFSESEDELERGRKKKMKD